MPGTITLDDLQHASSCTHCHTVTRCTHDSQAETLACDSQFYSTHTVNQYGCYDCNALFWPHLFHIKLAGPPVIGALYRKA